MALVSMALSKCDGNIQIVLNEPKNKSELKYSGTINSDLHEKCKYCNEARCYHSCDQSKGEDDEHSELEEEVAARREYNGAVDGIESLILSLACQGYGVNEDTFQKAIQTTLDAIANIME